MLLSLLYSGTSLQGLLTEGQHSEEDRKSGTPVSQGPRVSDPQEINPIDSDLIKQQLTSGVGLSPS